MNRIILIISGILSGIFGSLGVGGGGVLIVFLNFFLGFSYTQAAGLNLIFFIPIAFFSIIIYLKQKKIDIKKSLIMILSGLPGAVLGTYLGTVIETSVLSKLLGVFFIIISLKALFFEKSKK